MQHSPSSDAAKRRIRDEVRASRAARITRSSEADRLHAQYALATQLRALITEHAAARVTCYAPLIGEPDTTQFLSWAFETGIEVLLPVSLPGGRIAWALHNGAFTAGRHGIPEPAGPQFPAQAAGGTDLMLIPACAVDDRGTRLGWGLGYYDRCLELVRGQNDPPPVFAIVHDDELRHTLPHDPHDAPVNGVVTPTAVRRFAEPPE